MTHQPRSLRTQNAIPAPPRLHTIYRTLLWSVEWNPARWPRSFSCMEVAMPASSSSSVSRISRTAMLLGVLGLSLLLYGCSDMITFAQQDREAGIDLYNHGDYAKAAGAFRAALRQDPRDYMSHYYLGLSALQIQNYQQALVAFRSCIDTQNITLAGAEDNGTRLKAMDGLAQAIMRSDDGDLEVNKIEQIARNARGRAAWREFMVLAKGYRYRLLPDMEAVAVDLGEHHELARQIGRAHV